MPELEFETTIIRVVVGLEKTIEDTGESFTADSKISQAEIKNVITEI